MLIGCEGVAILRLALGEAQVVVVVEVDWSILATSGTDCAAGGFEGDVRPEKPRINPGQSLSQSSSMSTSISTVEPFEAVEVAVRLGDVAWDLSCSAGVGVVLA